MARVTRSPAADEDLEEIWLFIARDKVTAADRFLDTLLQRASVLAEWPGIGPPCEQFGSMLRSFPVGNYLMFYRPTDDGIELVRVLHGARDLPPLFEE